MKNSVRVALAAGFVSAGSVLFTGCASAPAAPACDCGCAPCECGEVCNCLAGRWALDVGGGWLGIEKDAVGAYSASFLYGGGSPVKMEGVAVNGGAITMRRPRGKDRFQKLDARVENGTLKGTVTLTEKDGSAVKGETPRAFTAKRIPALPAAPNLDKLEYGAPVDLFADGLDGWKSMNQGAHFGWSFRDGVLSNRILRDKKGKPKGANANIVSKRADFTDFKIRYEVRVLPGCNSGVYLRGIYELQVLDSYGKKVDCHNMAAPYGRITPSCAAEKPAGEWQTVEAVLCDRHVTVRLNGKLIVDNKPLVGVTGGAMTSDEFVPGPFYLQGDHSDADFRNMVVLPIVKK